jgi:hypothetical protein
MLAIAAVMFGSSPSTTGNHAMPTPNSSKSGSSRGADTNDHASHQQERCHWDHKWAMRDRVRCASIARNVRLRCSQR